MKYRIIGIVEIYFYLHELIGILVRKAHNTAYVFFLWFKILKIMSELALQRIRENIKSKAKSLNLSNCKATTLPPEIEQCHWLTELFVDKNDIIDLSPIEALTELRWLNCSYTKVNDLKPLSKLVKLYWLHCSSTDIDDLHPVSELINLRILFCESTKIRDLSPLSNLNNLYTLNCNNTKVRDISPLLGAISREVRFTFETPRDNEFSFQKCPLVNPPIEIIKQGNSAILNYIKEKGEDTVKLREVKMLIVGEGGAGKTSLLRRLYQKDKALPEENESTKGIEIHRHDFKMSDGSDFRLNVWDFGGQEIYHATHQFFLTKRSLYVLIDDTRRDDRTVHDKAFKYWLEVVDLLSDHSSVLLFQNEKSGRSKQIDLEGIRAKFGNVKDVWRGNLELPGSADKLGEAIEFYARNLPHIGEDLPAKWVSIRQEMEELGKNKPHITQHEYFDIYSRHLDFDRTKALHLSRYFHDLGVFLHFQDDDLLARTVILQNTWATEAVFKMLDDEVVKAKYGRFDKADCARVWQDSSYAYMHPELLALMEKFELCYRLPDSRFWLAPQLRPASKPEVLKNWAKPGDLVLRYKYEFLPKGLISRLMVRQHRFVRQPDRGWVSGVFFEQDGSELIAEIPPSGGEIVLRARGGERKALLSVISSDLDALNATFHGLPERVSKHVPCICSKCKSNMMPKYFDYKNLLYWQSNNILEWRCEDSFELVSVIEMLHGIEMTHLPKWANNDKIVIKKPIKTLKLFLASSMSLEERREFPGIILQLNKLLKSDGIQIEPVLCDFDAPSGDYGGGRFQDHFNRLLADCEVALVLFYHKAGAFTLEEMQIARKSCRKTFVYFKKGFTPTDEKETADLSAIFKIKGELSKGNDLIYNEYTLLSEFTNLLTTDLQKYLKGL